MVRSRMYKASTYCLDGVFNDWLVGRCQLVLKAQHSITNQNELKCSMELRSQMSMSLRSVCHLEG